MHDEHITLGPSLTKPLTSSAMPSVKAVDVGFHLDELRVHVIGARLGHGRQRIGRDPRPGRNADVASFHFRRPDIFPNTETPAPNVPAYEKCDHSPASKSLPGRALALNPYIVENSAGGAVPIRKVGLN